MNPMKAPAFQFYADDFLAGTLDLSQADVGAYVRLLCHQWNRGSIPAETEKQQRLAGGPVSADVLAKFPAGADGLLRNLRMEQEREKQAAFREMQRKKGLLSAAARTAAQPSRQPKGNSPSPSSVRRRESAPLWRQRQILEEAIATHPANRDWSGHDETTETPEAVADLIKKRTELARLKSVEGGDL